MKYRRLGASGLKVSEVALGSWLTFGHAVSQDVTDTCVRAALDLGINFIDTADVYALGACETAIGKALVDIPRKDYVLASKVFFPMGEGVNDRGLSRKHIHESLDASLARLRTDYLDLYQCHRHDPETPVAEVVRTMDDLIRRGKILYWGVSLWPAERIAEAVETAQGMGAEAPVSNQPCYNMLVRDIEAAVLPVSSHFGIGQIVYSPLAQGLLTGKYRRGHVPSDSRAADARSNQFIHHHMGEENMERIERLNALAAKVRIPLAQLALAWCLRDGGVNSVIIGARKPEQIRENAGATDVELTDELLDAIEACL